VKLNVFVLALVALSSTAAIAGDAQPQSRIVVEPAPGFVPPAPAPVAAPAAAPAPAPAPAAAPAPAPAPAVAPAPARCSTAAAAPAAARCSAEPAVAPAPAPALQRTTIQTDTSNPPARERAQGARLSAKERAALAETQRWEREAGAAAQIGVSGAWRVAYGHQRPTITCAPLHVCTIRLIAGETITSLALGDTVRWLAQQTTAGDTPVVVIKPTQAGISTNAVITTSAGRIYYLHLVADRRQYMPLVEFFDPAAMLRTRTAEAEQVERLQARLRAAEQAAQQAKEQAQEQAAQHRERTVVAESPTLDPTKLDFAYRCEPASREARDFVPARIFGSDTHTFVQMPQAVLRGGEMPAVFARADGQHQLLNARRSGDFVVVDGRPQSIALVLGVGQQARTVNCNRVDPGSRWAAGGDVTNAEFGGAR